MQPKIVQISSTVDAKGSIQVVGLGEDNKMYIWAYPLAKWLKFDPSKD